MLRRLSSVLAGISAISASLLIVTATPASASAAQPAAVGLLALRNGDITASDNSHYGVIVMNAWEAGRIPALKAANPGVKVLVYKDMSSTRSYAVRNGVDDAKLPTGLGYAFADRTHPEWFLTDNLNQRIEWDGYPDHWWMDVANPSYMDAWAANVSAELQANGWDGVMIDNAITSTSHYLVDGQSIPRYPDDASYANATETFLSTVSPRLRGNGFLVVPNMGGNSPSMDQYQRWVGITGGALREHFGRWGSDGNGLILTDWNWRHQIAQQEAAQARGLYLAVAYGRPSDTAFARYARSSFLLGWDGGPSSLLYTPPAGATDPWSPDWTTDVGLPAGPRTAVGNAWVRRFTDGVVVVNPGLTSATVNLGGTYVDPDGQRVGSVALGSGQGMVLRTVPGAASLPALPVPVVVPSSSASPTPAPAAAPPAGSTIASPGSGYWVLGEDGGVFSYGGAAFYGSLPGLGVKNHAVTLTPTPSGKGYWMLGADGGIFSFGDAAFYGSVPGLRLPAAVTAIDLQPTPDGGGYWILGADGGIFTFGNASFFGSVPGLGVRSKAVKITPTPSGNGYWVLGDDGGIFSFGDAGFHGSLPGIGVRNRSIALAATPTGNGYWVLGADGGIFTFGDAVFQGSVPGLGVRETGVQLRSTMSGAGYYVLSQRGQVFAFGDAPALGSPANLSIKGQDMAIVG
ncbi:MAG: hypothetical protein QOF60_1954 [Actinomycetota bacterium]|jgi:hypothetical protein|nr:hypothetical protein [Actinomycetota bacterium]